MKDKSPVQLVHDKAPDALAVALANMKGNLPSLIEFHKLMAKIQRARYLAYIENGFSPKDALELCKVPH